MQFILAEKIKMTQIPDSVHGSIPVTAVKAGPMVIVQIKTKELDGYNAIVCGFETRKHVSKPVLTALKKHLGDKVQNFKFLREFTVENPQDYTLGDTINVSTFENIEAVKVQGITKAKGFQGVVKRHHFRGAPATHGTKHALREPGSIGATGIQRVAKGIRMAGRTGGDTYTMTNVKIVKIDTENNVLFVKGSIPGRKGTLLKIISK